MKLAICHYSFHRRFEKEGWTLERLVDEVKALGVDGLDFHARYIGQPEQAAQRILAAIAPSGLTLTGLSLSSDFNQPEAEKFAAQVQGVTRWLDVAVKVKAPACRIFGGHLSAEHKGVPAERRAAWQRMLEGVAAVTAEAAKRGVILAIENHGGLPCTAGEQVEVIRTIHSPSLRATVDVGNYMGGGQEAAEGTALAAPHAVYVHLKDNKKVPDKDQPWGWTIEPCTLGDGAVDLPACMAALARAGYNGYAALEYEGPEDEATAVPKSVAVMKKLVQ